ncbi:hypothetical protein STEG23_004236 [Scotinomys teguina]
MGKAYTSKAAHHGSEVPETEERDTESGGISKPSPRTTWVAKPSPNRGQVSQLSVALTKYPSFLSTTHETMSSSMDWPSNDIRDGMNLSTLNGSASEHRYPGGTKPSTHEALGDILDTIHSKSFKEFIKVGDIFPMTEQQQHAAPLRTAEQSVSEE